MEYFHAILKGVLLGITVSFMIGAAFFTLIQTSIHKGFKSGMYVAFGIFLSDSFVVFISSLGAASIMTNEIVQHVIGCVGSLVLIGMGIYTYKNKVKRVVPNKGIDLKKPFFAGYIIKGFALNITNPAIWLFWIFWVGVISTNYTTEQGVNLGLQYTFFGSTLLFVFMADLLKCFIADKIRNILTYRVLFYINRVLGIILIGFGTFLLLSTLNNIFHIINVGKVIG